MSQYSNFAKKSAVFLINVISKTWRIKINGDAPLKPSVVAFWHGTMLPVWKYFGKIGAIGLVSQSKDGETLCRLISKWGVNPIRGSSSKGGKEVLLEMIKLANNNMLLVTPDGPKGPIHKFKAGAAITAQRAKVPLYLAKVEIKFKKVFPKAWDLFQMPLPFSKIIITISKPINIPDTLSKEEVSGILCDCESYLS